VERTPIAFGDRTGLMRQYQELNEILAGNTGIESLPAAKRLYERLLAGAEGWVTSKVDD